MELCTLAIHVNALMDVSDTSFPGTSLLFSVMLLLLTRLRCLHSTTSCRRQRMTMQSWPWASATPHSSWPPCPSRLCATCYTARCRLKATAGSCCTCTSDPSLGVVRILEPGKQPTCCFLQPAVVWLVCVLRLCRPRGLTSKDCVHNPN